MKRAAILLVALGACSQPPLTLTFGVTDGPEDACFASPTMKAASCSDVALPCLSAVSIRVYSPDDAGSPYISECKELMGQPNLCAIAGVDLTDPIQSIPDETLEVDIVVFPLSATTVDPMTGKLQCPTGVEFDAAGFPIGADEPCTQSSATECPPDPAIGGRAFYHPGDPDTFVALGCVDISQVDNASCSGGPIIDVSATVDDFDTDVTVPPTLGDELTVSVGQPKATTVGTQTEYVLDSAEAFPLARTVVGPVPAWSADIATTLTSPCLEVLEDGAQTTATLSCIAPANPTPTTFALDGWRLAKSTLDQILTALGEPEFPDAGLVVGIVLDPLGNPIANQTVAPTSGTIRYLSADRTAFTAGGSTTASGIFVSTDAQFGTAFSVASGVQTAYGYGGLVEGKVTIVVLQYQNPVQD